MEKKYIVDKDDSLVDFFKEKGIAKNKIKTYVRLGFVCVNGEVVSKLPFYLVKGDTIDICDSVSDIHIVYEDNNYLVVNKEAGLLTISTDKYEGEDTLYRRVRKYLNSKGEYSFIVNRIDKETSGLVIFVKNDKLKSKLQDNWNSIVKKRCYIALVSGKIVSSGKIDNYLYEDKMTFSHSTKFGGKRAITLYKPIKYNNNYSLLDINILTGRKNQIRVHFSEMGHSIVGDKKYGSHDNRFGRLMLQHYRIVFICPISGKLMDFSVGVSDDFYYLFY